MRRRIATLALLATACAAGDAPGQEEPAGGPALFAPGVISTASDDELTPTFSPDGERLVFARRREGGPFTLHESRRTSEGWSRPAPLPFSGAWNDQAPSFSPDGTRLFFQSRRPVDPSRPPPADAPRDDDLWVVEVRPDGWGTPRSVGRPVRRAPKGDGFPFEGREMAPSVDREGTLYYWSAIRGDTRGESDLYRARRAGDGWAEPENLGAPVNGPVYETHPWIAPDGSFLLFACDGCPDAIGGSDLYVSRRGGDGWSTPENLGPRVNSEAYDFGASITPDGRRLVLSSNRGRDGGEPGRQNVWVVDVDRVPALAFLERGSDAERRRPASPGRTGKTTVEHLANEGVLVSDGERSVLIDGLFGEGLAEYPAVAPATRDSLERGLGRFGTIDRVLVTHVHRDHFDARSVARHLAANPWARLIAPAQAVDSLRAEVADLDAVEDRIDAPRLAPGETADFEGPGVTIRAVGLVHPPSRNQPVEMIGWRVELGGVSVVHVGDAVPTAADLAPLLAAGPPDLLLAPWWALTEDRGAALLAALGIPAAGFHVGRDGGASVRARVAPGVEVLDPPGRLRTLE